MGIEIRLSPRAIILQRSSPVRRTELDRRIILLGLCMDAIYQWIVLKTFYPDEAAIVAIALAFFPYVLLRGPIERIARVWLRRRSASKGL